MGRNGEEIVRAFSVLCARPFISLIENTAKLLMSVVPMHLTDEGITFLLSVQFLNLPFSDFCYMVEVQ